MRVFWANLWQRRWFRWTFTPVAAVVLSWCCICLILNYAGEKRWQKVKARLEAEGETFDYFALLPPSIPDEQNFCAIEALNGIRAPEGSSPSAMLGKSKREAIKAQTAFFTPRVASAFGYDALNGAQVPDDREILRVFGENTLMSAGLPPLPGKSAPPMSWPDMRLEMERQAPILLELCQAAGQRPLADHLPRPERHELPEVLLSISFEHVNVCENLAKLCRSYSIVCLKCGDVRASLEAALAVLRFGNAAQSHPSLLGHLVAITHQAQFFSLVWLHLEGRHLDENELALIQDELKRLDLAGSCLASLRSEMVLGVNASDHLHAHPGERWKTLHAMGGLGLSSSMEQLMPLVLAGIPSGAFSLTKASSVELQYDRIIQTLKKSGLRNLAKESATLDAFLRSTTFRQRPDVFVAKLYIPILTTIQGMLILLENQRLQALLALALERHFLRHGIYPATLAAMDSEFRAGLSLLDVNGEPMHYTLVPGGRFRLWSPGTDGVDDGGKFGREMGPGSRSPSHPSYKGDWVWRYEPAVKAP